MDNKEHWEKIYSTKALHEVSWYQPTPETSLSYFSDNDIPLDAKIIDIGGGDSFLVEHLLERGYTNVTVLDISAGAIARAKERLGEDASKVKWIESNITTAELTDTYDFWHDRAAFHFLTDLEDIAKYLFHVDNHVSHDGHIVIGTFSQNGPEKCSGLKIKQYSVAQLNELFSNNFIHMASKQVVHPTPFDTTQEFTFCHFKRDA